MRAPPDLPAPRLGVFTFAEAAAAGWSSKALARAIGSGDLVRVRRGVFASVATSGPDTAALELGRAAVAATLVLPGVHASHLSAAVALGLPVWAPTPRACVTAADRRLTAVDDVHLHHTRGPVGLTTVAGVRLTAPARTIVDIACEHGTEAALVTGNAALATATLSAPAVVDATTRAAGRRGIDAARALPTLLDGAAESPLESRSRWHLSTHELPPPWTQIEIMSTFGEWIGRVDFFWPCGVVGEVDGSMKYVDSSVLAREKWRQERLERLGLIVIRWGARDLLAFGPTARRIRLAIASQTASARAREWTAIPPQLTRLDTGRPRSDCVEMPIRAAVLGISAQSGRPTT